MSTSHLEGGERFIIVDINCDVASKRPDSARLHPSYVNSTIPNRSRINFPPHTLGVQLSTL
jgi:hypothetical protein